MRPGTNVFIGVSLLVVGCVDPGPVGFEGPDEADLNRTAAMEASGEPWAEVAASEIPGFAGFYLDEDGSLVASASIARSANAARQYVANWQRENGYDGLPIRFREVEYDFFELSRWKAQLSRPAIEAGATMVDADEVANRVVIGLPPGASEDPLLHILSSFDIPRKAVQMIQFGSMQLLDDIVPTTLRDTVRPLIGGLENGPDGCTIGFITEYEGEPAFVTASHCSNLPDQSDATLFRQPLWGPRVGQETSDQSLALSIDYPSTGTTCSYPGCRGSDTQITDIFDTVQAALGRVARTTWVSTTQDTGSITLSNPPYQHVVQKRYRNQIISGTTIDKVGRTTGWTRGHLRRSCISIDQFRCMYTGSMYVDRGDSGSPVFIDLPYDNVALIGVLAGATNDPPVEAVFSVFDGIEYDHGTSLPVCEPPGCAPPLNAQIQGSIFTPSQTNCIWQAQLNDAGTPPYTYKWYRDGALVSQTWYYAGHTGSMDFILELEVVDSRMLESTAAEHIYVGYGSC